MAYPEKFRERRFTRAANLELDFDQPTSVDGYMLTGTGRQALKRLVPAMQKSSTSRAWSLTGPYGTGKSAFALYLSALLTSENSPASKKAKSILKESDPELAKSLLTRGAGALNLASIPVTGTNEPLQAALLRGLERSLSHHAPITSGKVAGQVRKAQESVRHGKAVTSSQIVDLFDTSLSQFSSAKGTDGAFLIIDELGRLLEYANYRPEESDIAVLQDLAEYANRSTTPFLLMTIRHQSLTAYSEKLSSTRKKEWEKIQGRFEDIEFIEPADEMLRLLARALEASIIATTATENDPNFQSLVTHAWKLGIAPDRLSKAEFTELMTKCYPLHPVVSTVLGFVFRRLGQNERSAFSFLFSHEPYGLQEFLRHTDAIPDKLYGVPRLYDYLSHNAREALYTSSHAKRWAEIETVLDQLVSATEPEEKVVKSIGLIGALNATERLRPTREIVGLTVAASAKSTNFDKDIDALINRSVVVERTYNRTLALWEGSDVDLEAEIVVAKDLIDKSTPASKLAARYLTPRPIVAKRHSFQTGTLRYFSVVFTSLDELEQPRAVTDTLVISVVVLSKKSEIPDIVRAIEKLTEPSFNGRIFCIASDIDEFTSAIRELAALEWVRDHVKALEGDRTARRELAVRLEDVQRLLDDMLDRLLNPIDSTTTKCRWFRTGTELKFNSTLRLQDVLSETCDKVYCSSPRIHNELLNRRELSSAAAAARRNLIERMFQNANEPELGIEGTPPEKSMYLSLLAQAGLHRKTKDGWQFHAPTSNDQTSLSPTWAEISQFFAETEKGARPVSELFTRLSAPPFGVLPGPLPVLFCAALLVFEHEVALYKDGTFIPSPDTPDLELLMKSPNRYTVQRWRISGVRSAVFQRLADLLGRELPGNSVGKTEILELIKPLLRFFKGLNEYSLYTKSVSDVASGIRQVLQKSNEPDTMLFSDLPKACGVNPFAARERTSTKRVDEYIETLRNGLRDLQTAYDRLLEMVFSMLRSSFGVDGDLKSVRGRLTKRAAAIVESCGNPVLKEFITRMLQPDLDDKEWTEAVAGVVVIKPPAKWRDGDLDRFQQEINSMARLFKHVETLLVTPKGKRRDESAETVRIGVTTADSSDAERVVHLNAKQRAMVDIIESSVEDVLKRIKSVDKTDIGLAALARVAKRLLD